MEMADFWILEKQYVHKLFKVLAPRLQSCPVSYTRMYKAPQPQPVPLPTLRLSRTVIELRGHPFPPLVGFDNRNRNLLQNVLLDEAKKAYRKAKYAEFAAKLGQEGEASAESAEPAKGEQLESNESNAESDAPTVDKGKTSAKDEK